MPPKSPARARAIGAMCGASFLFSLMGVATKLAAQPGSGSSGLPAPEIALVRYAAGVAFLLVISRIASAPLLGSDRPGLLWRGIYGGIASTAFFISLHLTSLTHATLLNSTNVVFASLFAITALGERLSLISSAAILAALAGVGLVTQPVVGHIHVGDAIALFSGVLAGLAIVQVRRLRRTETSFSVFFYFNLVGLPVALAALLFSHAAIIVPTLRQAPILMAVAVTSVGGQLLMTYGYKELPAAQGSLLILTSVVLSAALSHLVFHDLLTIHTLLGGLLILVSAAALCLPAKARA